MGGNGVVMAMGKCLRPVTNLTTAEALRFVET